MHHSSGHAPSVFGLLRAFSRVCAITAAFFNGTALAASSADRPLTADFVKMLDQVGETAAERAELRAVYDSLGESQIWSAAPRHRTFIRLLASLEVDGIDIRQLGLPVDGTTGSKASGDIRATRTILRAAHIIASGSIAAESIPGWSLNSPPPTSIVAAFVESARNKRLNTLFDDLRPPSRAYHRLRAAHGRYLRLAAETWPPLEISGEVYLNASDAHVAEVIRRLVILGDLTAEHVSTDALLRAVMRFQSRHGLVVDGRIGPATLAALNVSPASRAEQIAVNLEYWRLLPRIWPSRYIAVNTAAAQLDLMNNDNSSYTSRVIVGDPSHATPVMTANVTAVTFNPSWTIPKSIAANEILPHLRRDPTYLERSHIEILGRSIDPHGLQVHWQSYSRTNFPFQLRQVPGTTNPLGFVKFEMANNFDVYLHDTPDKSLFERSTRALSHGCVRVECANVLAQKLIEDPAVGSKADWLAPSVKDGQPPCRSFQRCLSTFCISRRTRMMTDR